MKTAVSMPDDIFASADCLAAELGVSRSELYARAVDEFVARHRQTDITARLNALYAEEGSGIDPDLRRAQAASVGNGGW